MPQSQRFPNRDNADSKIQLQNFRSWFSHTQTYEDCFTRGAAKHSDSVLSSHPAALGLTLGVPGIFFRGW